MDAKTGLLNKRTAETKGSEVLRSNGVSSIQHVPRGQFQVENLEFSAPILDRRRCGCSWTRLAPAQLEDLPIIAQIP